MIALYYDTRDLRDRIEGLLGDADLYSTRDRDEFQSFIAATDIGIAGLQRCSSSDVAWLREVFAQGLARPSCIVVTPLSLARLQRLRTAESHRFQVVWEEEAHDHLRPTLGRVNVMHRDPLRLLGRRMLWSGSLHWSMVKAVERICRLSDEWRASPPAKSVRDLAQDIEVPAETFRRYWKENMPLRCGPKQLLSWALLMWALGERPKTRWDAIAGRAGVRRRTLERHSVRLVGCTLSVATREPTLVRRRFRAWVSQVSDVKPPAAPPLLSAGKQTRPARVQRQWDDVVGSPGFFVAGRRWTALPGSPGRPDMRPDFVAQAMMAGQ